MSNKVVDASPQLPDISVTPFIPAGTAPVTHDLSLLRTVVGEIVSVPGPGRQLNGEETIQWYQNPPLAFQLVDHATGARKGLRQPGVLAASKLAASIEKRIPDYARGTRRNILATAIATEALGAFAGRAADTITEADLSILDKAIADWFASKVAKRTHVVPCAILLNPAKPFSVGPVRFSHIIELIKRGHGDLNEALGPLFYGPLLQTLAARSAQWVAEVEIEGCELARAEQTADLATDLALVAVQFVVPWGFSRHMARITGRTLPPTVGSIYLVDSVPRPSIHNYYPGHGLAAAAFDQFVAAHAAILESVGRRVANFIRQDAKLEKLERAWCDAAYWFHEGMAEPQATIAVAKLETSIEVLFSAQSSKGSKKRLCEAIGAFYGLRPKDPLPSDPSKTVEKYATEIVNARSKVLHGTSSTLGENVESMRASVEMLSADMLWQTSTALDQYATTTAPIDEAAAFLVWIKSLRYAAAKEAS